MDFHRELRTYQKHLMELVASEATDIDPKPSGEAPDLGAHEFEPPAAAVR